MGKDKKIEFDKNKGRRIKYCQNAPEWAEHARFDLEEKERNPCCISFEGAGGYVAVSVVDKDNHRTVDVESREFEYQAKRFLETL